MLEIWETLSGDKDNRILQCMKKAGWFAGRKVDISNVLCFYEKHNVELFPAAQNFFEEFYGIASGWFFGHRYGIEHGFYSAGVRCNQIGHNFPDLAFMLFPENFDEDDDSIYDEEVQKYTNDNTIKIGEIGYYYPAEISIGTKGTIYAVHDYDGPGVVHEFNNIFQLIAHELSPFKLDGMSIVAMEHLFAVFREQK